VPCAMSAPVAVVLLLSLLLVPLWGCGGIPRKYVKMAEPDVTLTAMTTHPEQYRGKVVLLGGVMVAEEEHGRDHWLRVKNRPLDEDNMPHRPLHTDDAEAGYYWVVLPKEQLPPGYRHWARMTVVGRVTGERRARSEPVLSLLYVRGWGVNPTHDAAWEETVDANYLPTVPAAVGREYDTSR
jgi:starvation-inducible outer membrane lipoprotein